MATSWSSASTGKPQLSYAERLRKAKGQQPISSTLEAVVSASSENVLDSIEKISKGNYQTDSTSYITSTESGDMPPPYQVNSPETTSKMTITDSKASDTTMESQTSTQQPLINVWDARKKMLREKERAKQEPGADALVSNVAGPSRNTPEASQVDKVGTIDSTKESNKDLKNSKGGEERKNSVQGEAWLQKIQMLNGGEVGQQDSRGTEQSRRNKSRGNHLDDKPFQSNTREDQSKAKAMRKKKDEITSTASNGASLLPSLTDTTAWPSPDVSISSTTRLPSETRGEDRNAKQSATSSPSNGLQGLDVEIVKRLGGETQKKGKQWISIVPTITHTAPLPGAQTKRKTSRGQSTTSSNGNGPSIKSESKKSNSLLLQENQIKSPTTSPTTLLSPLAGEATTSSTLSPNLDSLNSQPKMPRRAAKEQGLAASPQRDQSSSPLHRSPSIDGGGSIRGPRFSGDKIRSKNGNSTPVEVVDELNNALHLSHEPSLDSLGQNKDGSFLPVRATARTFLPMSSSQVFDSTGSWQSISDRNRQNGTASPRGSRGRGKSSKTSDDNSPTRENGNKNDIEERGLPSDVPSGPRLRNGDVPLTSSRDGARHYRRNHNNNANYSNYAMPMSYGPPLAMYGQPPAGQFYYSPLGPPQPSLERTPIEFAPQGDASKSEPSQTLLHQMEFYFSHRNLEGDFYLRKNMDSQGYVPIEFVANFNKVKKMTEEIDVIKSTLLFSKVLQVDTERSLVRKLVDWHLYILTDGERPQQEMYHPFAQRQFQQFAAPPPLASPLPFGQMGYYGSQPQPLYFPIPYHQGYPPSQTSTMQGSQSGANQQWSHQPSQSSTSSAQHQDEANGDNEDDEVLGIVAAEGLAGAPKA